MAITELKPKQLHKTLSLKLFNFETTDKLEPLKSIIGQERAIKSIQLALEMNHNGYNVFVTGMSGTGRSTIVRDLLKTYARKKPIPEDWIYVYNFRDEDIPRAFSLPAGKGKKFDSEMQNLVETLKKEVPATFSSEEYEKQNASLLMKFTERKRKIMNELDTQAREMGIQIQSTPAGFQTVVLKDDQPMSSEDYENLSEENKKEIHERLEKVQEKINSAVREVVKIDREAQQSIRKLNEKVASFIVDRYIHDIKQDYISNDDLIGYLNDVRDDIINNIDVFLSETKKESDMSGEQGVRDNHFKRYTVNVLIDNSDTKGAPVIYEPNPTYNNLFGRIDKQVFMGSQITDHTMLKPGSLHRANGGYLITEADHVLTNSYVYDALKRVIKTREIRTEDVSELYGFVSAAGIRPEPIPMNMKVILIGANNIYYLLQAYDPDFSKIFKIRADFDYETDSSRDHITQYAKFISKVCIEEHLLPFHRTAVREVVHYGNRLVDDQEKISLRFGSLVGIIREANHYAEKENSKVVREKHVKKAISEYNFRNSMVEEKVQEIYKRNIYRIDVDGEKVGEINGLSVSTVGEYSFGRPAKITAKTFIGNENVVNIERKARLSGKFHDKGLLILSGYFNSKFGQYIPPSFSASLTFEQSYSMIDGDSASSTELYALISSLSDVPIKQGIAVTGSVNQNGEVQAIGGVNEKIEGFFQVCKNKKLTGKQGVIIPRSNVENLMIREDVLQEVQRGQFHIWAVDTIEDGLKILTEQEVGKRQKNGKFPKGTIFYGVEETLRNYARRAREFKKSVMGSETKSRPDKINRENGDNDDAES
ncbi:MAG: ATP-dependent protease [Calditrichaeota bacterium]|nr:AAA family ATPase [Calditrichota bacterium]RQW01242.1 MAG: ATP-dependent protease [Calditrichota bacterium]